MNVHAMQRPSPYGERIYPGSPPLSMHELAPEPELYLSSRLEPDVGLWRQSDNVPS